MQYSVVTIGDFYLPTDGQVQYFLPFLGSNVRYYHSSGNCCLHANLFCWWWKRCWIVFCGLWALICSVLSCHWDFYQWRSYFQRVIQHCTRYWTAVSDGHPWTVASFSANFWDRLRTDHQLLLFIASKVERDFTDWHSAELFIWRTMTIIILDSYSAKHWNGNWTTFLESYYDYRISATCFFWMQ